MNHPEYKRLKELVELHILDFLPEIDSKSLTLYDAMRYSLTAGGKRLRSVLLLAACELCGEKADIGLPYACALEYIQTYSLIHDDLPAIDNDDLRRGAPTNHKVYGEDVAILAGDGLLSAAFETMTKDMLLYLDDPTLLRRKVRAAFEIAKGTGCRGMVAGQIADVESVNRQCSKEMLDYIHLNKTAAFIRSSAVAGCYLAGADKERCNDVRVYGESLGLAFQIVNDIQDITGDALQIGKETGKDQKIKKCTYPLLFGMEESKEKARELLDRARQAVAKYYDEAEVFNAVIDFLEQPLG
ncbi:MAG: polyprenyl synthetase family protein [Eubacteriales bacterium]|nr:polyprenyl synthetase family protein [Eubacteriales bacterium]MDD3863289.1 polyprenyl synthetase family protein [Eubacteriales bacterium]